MRSLGTAMIFAAALLGTVLALGLYQWESSVRATRASVRPSPTPQAQAAERAATPTPTAQAQAPASGTATTAPVVERSAGEVAAGAAVFTARCNACHPGAKAGIGPALFGPEFTARYPEDGPLKLLVRQGRGGMTSFPPGELSDADLDAVVTYMRSLSSPSEPGGQPTATPRPRRSG